MPGNYVSRGIRKRADNYPLTALEVRRALAETEKAQDGKRDRMILLLGVHTGARVNELTTLRKDKIDWSNDQLILWDQKKDTKMVRRRDGSVQRVPQPQKKWRRVQVPHDLMAELKRYAASVDGELVFPYDYRLFESVMKRYFPGKSWHCMRHTYVTLSREAGRSIEYIMQQTGDSWAMISKTYEAVRPQRMRHETAIPIY